MSVPRKILLKRILEYLDSDIASGDLSSSLIPKDAEGKAKIVAKSTGVLAGLQEAQLLFEESGLKTHSDFSDGQRVEKGDKILLIEGKIQQILMIERIALNFLMKLSSIASSTADYMKKIQSEKLKTKMAGTRKVTPGFGWFEKRAMSLGGGDTHRWNLSDMVMFKDTHLKFFDGNITKLLGKAKEQISFSKKIELEIENPADIEEALNAGADIIMLDNMNPAQIKEALQSIENKNHHVIFEASGNITEKTFMEYARSGVDIISTSQIILHPHIHMDFSLRLE
jgi:nicotinate-nucleotide pyrophosphorylase (carboxylating)